MAFLQPRMDTNARELFAWIGVRSRFLFVFLFVEPAVADERAEGRRPSDVVAGIPVEKTAAQNVGAKKTPGGPEGGFDEGKMLAARLLLSHEQIRERIELRDVRGKRRKRIVVQI